MNLSTDHHIKRTPALSSLKAIVWRSLETMVEITIISTLYVYIMMHSLENSGNKNVRLLFTILCLFKLYSEADSRLERPREE